MTAPDSLRLPVRCDPLPRGGFTLTELLTVITVIGILAAILIPVTARVRENARRTTCTSNLRQIATSLLLYAGEHKGSFPPVATQWPPSDQTTTWGYAIWTYAGYREEAFDDPANDLRSTVSSPDRNLFHCPSTQSDPRVFPGVPTAFTTFYSYGFNCEPNGQSALGTAATTPVKQNQVPSPSRTAMVLEARFPAANYYAYRSEYGLLPHSGALNVAYYDGHVSLLAGASVPAGGGAQVFWRGY